MNSGKRLLSVLSIVVVAVVLVTSGVVLSDGHRGGDRDVLWQDNTIDELLAGGYDGNVTVGDMKTHGNFGLGTYDKANGEMIVLDGVVYQALWDGSVVVADDSTTTPFATLTFFNGYSEYSFGDLGATQDLENRLSDVIDENRYYAAKITGTFDLTVRSELPQEKPYRNFIEVLSTDERSWSYTGLEGTIVAIYCPESAEGINEVGWHFHFISDDGMIGGHVLKLTRCVGVTVVLDECTSPEVY